MSKAKKWTKKYAFNGGKLYGPSHKFGGIPIEVEGGEYIIKKESVKKVGDKVLDYINKHGKLPSYDSKKRRK